MTTPDAGSGTTDTPTGTATPPSGPPASFKEWTLAFVEEHWNIVLLFALLLLLAASHAFQIHYNRPPAVIQWNENMISAVVAAIMTQLKS